MQTFSIILPSIALTVFLISCSSVANNSQVWSLTDRLGLGTSERFITVPLNPRPGGRNDGVFDLYYFVRQATPRQSGRSVLFVAGGPGEILLASTRSNLEPAEFLAQNGFNVVFFHLRGAGFSQIPASSHFDSFIRTRYAVNDIEEIRKDLIARNFIKRPDGKWDAVIGWSYGTILAQQYAAKHQEAIEKLILIAPLSRHKFKKLNDDEQAQAALREFNVGVRRAHRDTLDQIYQRRRLLKVTPQERVRILEQVFGPDGSTGDFGKTEDAFGSLRFVIDHFCDLEQHLKAQGLGKYTRRFFEQLWKLRKTGWSDDTESEQREIGRVIKNEVLDNRDDKTHLPCDYHDPLRSNRVYYVMTVYDGISPRFLTKWLPGDKGQFHNALKESGGNISGLNTNLERVGIAPDAKNIEAWDPANPAFQHAVPTLILTGTADPVTVGEAADRFLKGINGPRTLVQVPGMGHDPVFVFLNGKRLETVKKMLGRNILFSGVVRPKLESSIIEGEERRVIADVNGRPFDESLKITLRTKDEIEGLTVLGAGVVHDPAAPSNEDNIFVEVKYNPPPQSDQTADTISWIMETPYFNGVANTRFPKAGAVQLLKGTLLGGTRNEDKWISITPQDLSQQLELLCSKIISDQTIEVWLKNTSREDTIIDEEQSWTAGQQDAPVGKGTFLLDSDTPRTIPQDHVKPFRVIFPDPIFQLSNRFNLVLRPPKQLESGNFDTCIPITKLESEHILPTEIPIVIRNTTDHVIEYNTDPAEEWEIQNRYFSVRYVVDSFKVPPSGATTTTARVTSHVIWKTWLEFPKKENLLPDGLQLIGFNIEAKNRIALVFRNETGTKVPMIEELPYIIPSETREACVFLSESTSAVRDCLIFSFIVSDPIKFEEATILDIIEHLTTSNIAVTSCWPNNEQPCRIRERPLKEVKTRNLSLTERELNYKDGEEERL